MGRMTGCLLAVDVDDTLMHNGVISRRNVEAIELFLREGGLFSLATGRTVSAVAPVLRQLRRVSPSVVAGGAMIVDFENQTVLRKKTLQKQDHALVQKALAQNLEIGVEVHSGKRVLTVSRTAESDDHQAYEDLETTVVSFEEATGLAWNKVLYFCASEQDRSRLRRVLEPEAFASDFFYTSAIIDGRQRFYLEQFPKGVSKAAALKELCAMMKIPKGKFFAIGDYDNDLEMLKAADISAAPSNACEAAKAAADFAVCSCEDGAVADFIEYLMRKEE